jgi:pentapeptide MXKDX repeat protein
MEILHARFQIENCLLTTTALLPAPQSDNMTKPGMTNSGSGMNNNGMNSGTTGTGMQKDGMSKDGMSKDGMSKDGMPAQPVDATQALNLSAGVSNCKVSRGRSFS